MGLKMTLQVVLEARAENEVEKSKTFKNYSAQGAICNDFPSYNILLPDGLSSVGDYNSTRVGAKPAQGCARPSALALCEALQG